MFLPSAVSPAPSSNCNPTDSSQRDLPLPKRKIPAHAIPLLSEDEISELAKRFAEAIPEDELSVCVLFFCHHFLRGFFLLGLPLMAGGGYVASLQGYLLKNKTWPRGCVDEVKECTYPPWFFRLASFPLVLTTEPGSYKNGRLWSSSRKNRPRLIPSFLLQTLLYMLTLVSHQP